jgi:putative heme-binding domain-containing protein
LDQGKAVQISWAAFRVVAWWNLITNRDVRDNYLRRSSDCFQLRLPGQFCWQRNVDPPDILWLPRTHAGEKELPSAEHRKMRNKFILIAFALLVQASLTANAEPPFGLDHRAPWSTSKFHGQPEPPPPYRAVRVYPGIQFAGPTVLTGAPGTKRWFVAERLGKIYSFPIDGSATRPDLFLDCVDLAKQLSEREKQPVDFQSLYGLTFDPQFERNRFCYVCYVVHRRQENQPTDPHGTRVVRLQVSDSNPPRCEIASEKTIITWLGGGHNGGCLKFGRDGFLYISTGDGGEAFPPDGRNTGQDLSDLLSSILRIDVHPADATRPYAIPADNPFVSLDKARGENWAYGLRNPWKMSFDRLSGELWVGDVGWELWELVFRVRKGDNYGWSLVEGRQPVHVEGTPGPTPVVPPTVEIPHTDGASITGGFVYRGKQFPELYGTYIFGDWETRRVWGVKVESENTVGERRELVEPTVRIVDFAEDEQGELYLLDNDAGTIHVLARNDAKPTHLQFPRKLSDTGIFESVAEHRLAVGVLPFSINAEQWSDYAIAERYLALPEKNSIRLHSRAKLIPGKQFSRIMDFPAETVLTKTLSLDLIQGDPASRRRIETQVLHFDGVDWRGYSYEWNDEQTDAALVEADGKSRTWQVKDSQAPGGKRVQNWLFASRMDCIRCHNPWSEHTLAFNIAQLNRAHGYGSVTDNQIRTLKHIGVLVDVPDQPDPNNPAVKVEPPKPPEHLPRLADLRDPTADLELRSRAYLHVNCSHCHRFNGGGSAHIYLQHDLPLDKIKALDLRPTQGTFGIRDARILASADPYRSVLLFRLAKSGPGHMPHLGSKIVDDQGVTLIHDWIASLPGKPAENEPSALHHLLNGTGTAADRAAAVAELLSTPSHALRLAQAIRQRRLSETNRKLALDAAMQQPDLAIRDLFEPFVPEEQRTKRLGESIRPQEILAMAGDVARGRQLFHESTVTQCRNCHRSEGKGGELGPDLNGIGKKLDRAKLLDSILQPSASIDPKYAGWLVETKSGTVITGLMIEKTDAAIVIKDMQNKQHRITTDEIEGLFPQRKSLMPDLLLRDFTAEQVADLMAYLSSLK